MVHKKIRIPRESAIEIMRALGSLRNGIEFEDLTKNDPEGKKNYEDMISRCDNMKKKIKDFTKICYDYKLEFNYYSTFEEFKADLEKDMEKRDKKFGSTYFDLLEAEILENERKLNELIDSHSQIREDLVSLIEKKHVLLKGEELIRTNLNYSNFSEAEPGENGIKQGLSNNLSFMTGVIASENEMKMKRMIFRISRGRAVTAFYSLEINNDEYKLTSTVRQRGIHDAENQNPKLQQLSSLIQSKDVGTINTQKKIFTIIFTGSDENVLLNKLLKVCEVFQASRYPVPKNRDIRNEINKIQKEINEKKSLMANIEKTLIQICNRGNKYETKRGYKYSLYKLFFEEEKMIFTTLNKCIVRDTFLDGKVWIPIKTLGEISALLNNLFRGNQQNKTSAYLEDIPFNENEKPPTFITVNEFTSAFQEVVNTYGTPRYREINPGYFTVVTFPFLFGVMYGDIGHGLILFIFAIYLCLFKNSIEKSKSLLKGGLFARYFLLLMGFFALYCGLLYNDFLSVPLNFDSCYEFKDNYTNYVKDTYLYKKEDCKYKFGVDPVWYAASNELQFVNSLKMKLSVILGVFQMTIGIILKGLNAIYEKDLAELIFIFFPQIILMLALFGYMDFLIFAKWATKYETRKSVDINVELEQGPNITFKGNISYNYFAPDIKTYLMNIFLKLGGLPDDPEDLRVEQIENNVTKGLSYKRIEIIDDQKEWILLTSRDTLEKVHLILCLVSVLCIILMLFPKIFIDYNKAKKKAHMNNNKPKIADAQNDNEEPLVPPDEIEAPAISNFIVQSSIETIEFVLGTVSNTASYLRLWALSLAHSQLARVFFEYAVTTLGKMTKTSIINAIILNIGFPIFAGVTFLVLLFMDMMECFLHCLRLHWVEFQNKFFMADGYPFKPFCFSQNLVLNDDEFKD